MAAYYLLQNETIGGARLLNIVESFSSLLAENSNSTNDSRTIERENISKCCTLIHYPAVYTLCK